MWLCKRCHTTFHYPRQPAGKVVVCSCSPGRPMTLSASYDDGFTDCGDYWLKVVRCLG